MTRMGVPRTEPEPVTVDFPLRGEWVAEHTPARRVPSHGTDRLGQRYAFDFLRIVEGGPGMRFFRGSLVRHLVLGTRLDECLGWGEPVRSVCAGTVVTAEDGLSERARVHLARDLAVVLKNALTFDPKKALDLRVVAGNHVIVRMAGDEGVHAFYAHARTGSVAVRVGDTVEAGEPIAQVGHSGNSTAPHLHFHLMDGPDLLVARGVPCRFRGYEARVGGTWVRVEDGVPGWREAVRGIG